ncbi:multicopper oxidase domain-containing protein [uncultured Shewanella sp.]|uniref:multicopper oxidase family protein n=1 Tax=uncultured Shewanella sp. TaxID=173975 RepID=UPI002601A04D|nr:multicopper oxidase domain-containing protein [uncultured Shewanella sp.]
MRINGSLLGHLSYALYGFFLLSACSDNNQDDYYDKVFIEPEVRRSSDGILSTTLTAAVTENTIQYVETGELVTVSTPNFEASLVGPTLIVNPGDVLSIKMINDLPDNPENQRGGAFPDDPYTINYHSHGLNVSPEGLSDNPFRHMDPGSTHDVVIKLPDDHACGTFWYHPHKHGSISMPFFGGMYGLLIVTGCSNGLESVPEVAAAKEHFMVLGSIRTDQSGDVPLYNEEATQFSAGDSGLWADYRDGLLFMTNNGLTDQTLFMRPGEVQRWRVLNAAAGLNKLISLESHQLHIVSNDGLTLSEMKTLALEEPFVLGSGNRVDMLIKAGDPGIYLLQAIDPNSVEVSVSATGIDPEIRRARVGANFPNPSYPVTLATVIVTGEEMDMSLPSGALPAPDGLPSIATMLNTEPKEVRNVGFEICGGQQSDEERLPSCGWYYQEYDTDYWGGIEFNTLLMMRNEDDQGEENPDGDPAMPRINYTTEGLFAMNEPMFEMTAGSIEEWTVYNYTFSDHPFHIHTNAFLLTEVNGTELDTPQWHDTILVPAATGVAQGGNINDATPGSITFKTYFNPEYPGEILMHCHIITHEDIGMMQKVDIIEETGHMHVEKSRENRIIH